MFWVYYPPFPFGEDSNVFAEGSMHEDRREQNQRIEEYADKLPEEEWLITSLLRGLVSMAFIAIIAAMFDRGPQARDETL